MARITVELQSVGRREFYEQSLQQWMLQRLRVALRAVLQALSPTHLRLNPKPQTPNPKPPQTPNPKRPKP